MSFFDDASLVFLPSGEAGKDGKAYSMKPTNGDGDFTFSRGSNLTATRVDSNGLIEKGRENLLLQSNQFDTTWVTTNASVTSGQTGYDGSSDAWLLEATNTASILYQNVSSSGVQTISVYAKAGTTDNLVFYSLTSPSVRAGFDLTSGSVNYELRNIDASIENVGNGWYRCSMVFSGASTAVRIYPADSSLTATIGDNIYIQDAQLEQGLVATEYIESGATTGKAGILEDSPRFDYSGGASCPSLLLEPSRTNLIGQSEYLVSINGGSVEYNSSISPEGLQNATKVIFGATTNDGATMNLSASCSGNTQYTWSAYVKNISGTGLFNIRIDTNTTTILVNQDITATSEWTRVSHTFTTDASATSFGFNSRYRSKADGNEILIWGAQLEEGSYPTSYIPNHSGGSVTREKDSCSGAGTSSTFNDSEGVLYLEASAIDNGSSEKAIAINDGTTNNRINIRIVNNTIKGLVILGGSLVCNISYTATSVITSNKIAFKYKRNDFALWLNGVEVGTDTSGSIFPADTLNELSFDYGGASAFFYGNVEQVLYFPTALSDVELTALTS